MWAFVPHGTPTGKTVVDLGAGLGHYTRYIRAKRTTALMLAYDGGIGCVERTHGLVQFLDLSLRGQDIGVFDWVLSLEVLEHIPPQYEKDTVDNVARAAREGLVLR